MRVASLVGLLLSGIVAGCGDGGPTLVPVKGRVTLEGKPLAAKHVRFVPDAGTPGQGAGGHTDEEGHYTLLAARPGATTDQAGVPAGKYRVVVEEPMFPKIAAAPPAGDGSVPAPAIGLPVKARSATGIPKLYTAPDTTPLRAEVASGGGVHDFPLKARP